MALALERELKFEADRDVALPDLTALANGGRVVALPTVRLEAVYYDTPDLRLARWDATLRHRTGDEPPWTVKVPAADDGPELRTRHEVSFESEKDATAVVFGVARGAALSPVARLVTQRVRFRIVGADDAVLAEVDDDDVVAYRGRRVVDRFREIEFELAEGADGGLAKTAARRLRKAGARPARTANKLLRAIAADGPLSGEVVVPRPARRASVAELVTGSLAAGAYRLITHDPGVRLDVHPEAVHQARVATRRLRSDIKTFAAFIDPDWAGAIRQELAWLGRALGGVRDADVLGARLNRLVDRLEEADQGPARQLLGKLADEREQARTLLLHDMATERYAALLNALVSAAAAPPFAAGAVVDRAGAKALGPLVAKRWRQVRAEHDRAVDDEGLHLVRIATKRARYATEAGGAVLGDEGAALAKALADVQGALGDLHDAAVAEVWLRGAVKPRGSTAMALAAGQLVVLDREAGDEARASWPKAWKRAAKAYAVFAS